jgi:SSS family solute:Na+ symporter
MKNLEDFFLASRKLPASLVFLSLAASWIGASSTLVSVDEAYLRGVSAVWVIGAPAILTALLFALFLVRPIRRLPILSLPDLVEMRYGAGVRHAAGLLIVWYMILLAASQMTALGSFLAPWLGGSATAGLLLGTGVVLLYSVTGGFSSVALTDGFQFTLLTAGLAALFFSLSRSGAWGEVFSLTGELGRSGFFDLFADFRRSGLMVLSFTCAWLISPIAWQRVQAARSGRAARIGLLSAAGAFLPVYAAIVACGMLLLPVFPSGDKSGPLLAALVTARGGNWLGVLLFTGVTAAVMSTLDTAVNTGALSLTRDVYQRMLRRGRLSRPVAAGRAATVIVTLAALLIATRMQSILQTLGLASELMTAGFFIPGTAMLFLRRRLPAAGLLGMVFGSGYALAGFFCQTGLLPLKWPAWPESVPAGLFLSLSGFLFGMAYELWKERGRA